MLEDKIVKEKEVMKKVLNVIKNNYIYIILAIFLILVNISVILTSADNEKNSVLIFNILLTLIGGVGFAFVYKKWNGSNIKIENIFLFTIIPLGIFYLLAFPYGTIMDEQNHFLRIYEITDGHFISVINEKGQGGNFLTSSFAQIPPKVVDYETQAEMFHVKAIEDKSFYEFSNTVLYSFICYIPQAIGVGIGKLFNLSFIMQVFMGRATNFICYVAIVYFAIKFLPFKKGFVYVIATLPITMQEMVSLSPDALTIAMSIAIVSFTLYMIYTKKDQMNKFQIAMMCVISIVLSMCKIVYLPLCLILFLIPKERFGTLKKKNIMILTLAVFVVSINLGWTAHVSRYLDSGVNGSSSSEQIDYIIHNPHKLVPIAVNTMSNENVIGQILLSMFGALLGYYKVHVFLPYIYMLIAIFIVSLLIENEKIVENGKKMLIGFCAFSVVVLMGLSLYIQWTPLKNEWISGIQGRYFIPIMLLLAILCTNKKIEFKGKLLNEYTLLFILLANLSAISQIILYFA